MTENGAVRHDHRRDIVFTFALALAAYVAWLLRDVLIMVYVAALFAVVLKPLVSFTAQLRIGRWQMNKGLAVFSLLVAMACALAVFGFLAIPPVAHDLTQFSEQAPSKIPEILDKVHQIPHQILIQQHRHQHGGRHSHQAA